MNALARFALNIPANTCDRCHGPLDWEKDNNGVVDGRWCATCDWTEQHTPHGLHDLRLERAPIGYAACLRCKRLLNVHQVMEPCAA